MIPEYKLYHGAVFSELIDRSDTPVSVSAYQEAGRLLNYVVSKKVGVQIRHATQRLHPWHFTFAQTHIDALERIEARLKYSFLVLVCYTDGFLCVPAADALASFAAIAGSQAWLRADRPKGKQYRLHGPAGEFPMRFPAGVEAILQAIQGNIT